MILIIYNTFRDYKKYLLFTLLIMLSFLLMFIFLSIYDYYDYQINHVVGNKEINRGLLVDILSDTNPIKVFNELDYIENYYPIYNNEYVIYNNKYYQVNYKFNSNDIKFGKSTLSNNEIIISYYTFLNFNLNENDIGNKVFTVTYNNKKYDLLLVGVVNNNKSQFYISLSDMENIFSLVPNEYYVLIDKYTNINKAENEFSKLGYYADIYDTTGYNEINQIKNIQKNYVYMLVGMIIISCIFINNIINNIISSEYKNIAILKAIGYRNRKIQNILLIILICLIIFSFMLISLLELIFSPLLNIIMNNQLFSFIYILKSNFLILLVFILMILVNIFKIRKKVKRLNVLNALQDD